MRKISILILLGIFLWIGTLQAQTIRIGTDNNMWYPYSYEENGVSKGLHIDIVNQALENLGYSFLFIPLPWKRCLAWVEIGEVDAILSVSYKPKRAEYLYYPPDAFSANKSDYRITQVEYSIVTYIDAPYEFNGDVKTLPKPVRAPLGYSIVEDLKKENVFVYETPGDINSFTMLVRDRNGCVVTLSEIADMLMNKPAFNGKIKISKIPFKTKSYFLGFSKKGIISKTERERIWEKIREIRENDELMGKLLEKY